MTDTKNRTIPWVEKYRPTNFDEIVLSETNKEICKNIVTSGYFPNLLFYGPPGTGKTTTIINLINSYQKNIEKEDNSRLIHLNASDDRGIDIIRNHILQFVNSKCLFTKGIKFIILDEVDYMTKNAQQALRYLIHMNSHHVRFCLICNYISRIDSGLKTELLKIRFNNLPQENIQSFLEHIVTQEQLNISTQEIRSIQSLYGSDIRSMINFIQCNHVEKGKPMNIINQTVWEDLTVKIKDLSNINARKQNNRYDNIICHTISLTNTYNLTLKNLFKDYLTYVIRDKQINVTPEFLNFTERLLHTTTGVCDKLYANYTFSNLERFSYLL
mgnify:FL=1|jgi:replication factor C subunit 3/5